MKRMNVFYHMAPGTRDGFLKDLMDNNIAQCAHSVPGCVQYQYMVPADDPDLLMLMEKWESEEAIRLHKSMPHFKKIQELKGTRVLDTEFEVY